VTSLLLQGLDRIATAAMRDQAQHVLYLDVEGFSTLEIAKAIGIKKTEVKTLKELAGDGVIEVMREDGYADVDIIRTLGIPTARVIGEPVPA
jgi:DNA-directed RNA polymerase specialized sigma24 family protein